MSQPPYTDPDRPGQPDGEPWWWPVVAVGIVAVCSAVGLVLLAGAAWLAWVIRLYLAVWFAVSIGLTTVVYVVYLLFRRDWRPRTTGYVLLASLVVFVLWVVNR